MVAAMREFEAGSLPTSLIPPFVTLRSATFAINERITEIYAQEEPLGVGEEELLKALRIKELRSALRAHAIAAQAAACSCDQSNGRA